MPVFVPKILEEIQSDMLSDILSNTPITDITVTSVVSRITESVALELDELYFQMITLIQNANLETTSGADLDTRASEFGLTRKAAQPATGLVTISDTLIIKIESNIFNGLPGPVAGNTFIYTDKTVDFPTSGSLIVGRGTSNAETVSYSSIDNTSDEFTRFELSSAFAFDHGVEESVILAQGGNRVITSGSVVQVPADDVNPEITFTLSNTVVILDGESELTNVLVSATQSGTASNVPAGAIREFESPPFSTATVTNADQIINGTDLESDQELRDRIRATIQTLSRGTARSLTLGAIGVQDPSTNQRVVSSNIIEPTVVGAPVKLYIDDGSSTGFVPTQTGQGVETVLVSAATGDRFLQLDFIPIVPEVLVDATNKYIDFDEGGGPLVATLTTGVYAIKDLLTEIKTQLEAAGTLTYTVTLNVFNNIRIQASAPFDLLWFTGTNTANNAAKILGYDKTSDDTGTNDYDANYQFRRILLKKNGVSLFPGIDYTINPFLGEIELVLPLTSGDQITAGDTTLRASVECTSAENYAIDDDTALTGTVTWTSGSTAVSAVGGAFLTQVSPGDYVKKDANVGGAITGTVSFTQGSRSVTGSGTTFTTELKAGDFIKLDSDNKTKFARILTVDSNVALTLVAGYTGTTNSGATSKAAPWARVASITDNNNLILDWTYAGTSGAGASSVVPVDDLAAIIDGGTTQIVQFLPFDFSTIGAATAEEVTDRIAANLNGAFVTTTSAGTKVTITSKVDGSAGSVRIVGGSANTFLNFVTTEIFGLDAYKYFTGLLQLVQKTIDGDTLDQENFPGIKAAGIQVEVLAPEVAQQTFSIDITPIEGVNVLSLIDQVKSAVASYVNSLGIGDDIILSEIIDRIQSIVSIYDVIITVPAANVAIADGTIAKVRDEAIAVG